MQFCCCNSSPRGDGNEDSLGCELGAGVAIHPREGTETVQHLAKLLLAGQLQFIPARGRKPYLLRQIIVFGVAIHPREGTETLPTGQGVLHPSLVAIHPREGTKTFVARWFPEKPKLQFIPARGRKQWFAVAVIIPYDGCNSSPRGDGNSNMLTHMRLMPRLQFIPVRGRKLLRAGGELGVQLLQFIPARGQKLVLYDEL